MPRGLDYLPVEPGDRQTLTLYRHRKRSPEKEREIKNAHEVDIQSLKSSDNSLKDEWLVIVFSLIFIAHFIPQLQEAMMRGWEILELASDYFWIIILTIVGGSFGSSGRPRPKRGLALG